MRRENLNPDLVERVLNLSVQLRERRDAVLDPLQVGQKLILDVYGLLSAGHVVTRKLSVELMTRRPFAQ